VLDAEDVEGKRRRADGDDAVLADDAVLLAPADEFAGEEQQRTLAAIDQNKLVDGSASGLRSVDGPAIARASKPSEPCSRTSTSPVASPSSRVRETGVLVVRTDYRKDGMFS